MLTRFLLVLVGSLSTICLAAFALQSLRERELRAARLSAALALLTAIIFSTAAFAPLSFRLVFLGISLLILAGSTVAFLWPAPSLERASETPATRFDERDILFARACLAPGSQEYDRYYAMHPENLVSDEAFRAQPGLLSSQAAFFQPHLFASPEASFFLTGALRTAVDGPVAGVSLSFAPAQISTYLCSLARYYGALQAGITELHPYHVYSHIGRGMGEWGAEIPITHRFAIAFTVAMDHEMVAAAPRAPGIMESARQYVESARVAVQLAAAIRALGYPARAHIDANYQVIAPLVARDAGLGEIGRMGLLMTPDHGPRVRLGVVTTTLPLVANRPDQALRRSQAVLDFCTICQKCAVCCPSASIPTGDREEIYGVLRWRINADTCFRYWCSTGTDCGRCLAVCPFSHPVHWTHQLVRWGIFRSALFRRAALRLDDGFYGRKPLVKDAPAWTL